MRKKEEIVINIRNRLEELVKSKKINALKKGTHSLNGLCAIGSLAIAEAFRKHGYKDINICGIEFKERGHVFVEHNDTIYDITISQFINYFSNKKRINFPKVYIGKKKDYLLKDYIVTDHFKYNTKNDIDKVYYFYGLWQDPQSPTKETTKLILDKLFESDSVEYIIKEKKDLTSDDLRQVSKLRFSKSNGIIYQTLTGNDDVAVCLAKSNISNKIIGWGLTVRNNNNKNVDLQLYIKISCRRFKIGTNIIKKLKKYTNCNKMHHYTSEDNKKFFIYNKALIK